MKEFLWENMCPSFQKTARIYRWHYRKYLLLVYTNFWNFSSLRQNGPSDQPPQASHFAFPQILKTGEIGGKTAFGQICRHICQRISGLGSLPFYSSLPGRNVNGAHFTSCKNLISATKKTNFQNFEKLRTRKVGNRNRDAPEQRGQAGSFRLHAERPQGDGKIPPEIRHSKIVSAATYANLRSGPAFGRKALPPFISFFYFGLEIKSFRSGTDI